MDSFSKACKEFSLTINKEKTEVMAQDAEIPPSIYVEGSKLSVVDNFKYLGSTISSNLSLDVEMNARIGKAATVMTKLNKRVWQNIHLTMNTRLKVYQAYVCQTGGKIEFIPSALPQTNSGYHLAGQNSKYHCAGEGQKLKNACSTQPNTS